MSKIWYEARIVAPGKGVDLVSDALAAIGCAGVTVEERKLDTFVPPDPDQPLPPVVRLKAYFQMAPGGAADLQKRIFRQLEDLAEMIDGLKPQQPELVEVRTEDWAENWKQHFQAVRIGERLVVRPSWEAFEAKTGDVVVTLDPGMAFGTGTHGTTRLCLEALAGLFAGPAPPARVLDVGTGSGILAIATAALGAGRVLACDIEPEACRTARENARQNGLADRVEVTGAPLDSLEKDFDLVLANILAEENVRLAAALADRIAPGGHLVLSGILEEKEGMVAEGFMDFPLDGPTASRREEWSCLVYRRRP